MHFILWNSR